MNTDYRDEVLALRAFHDAKEKTALSLQALHKTQEALTNAMLLESRAYRAFLDVYERNRQ